MIKMTRLLSGLFLVAILVSCSDDEKPVVEVPVSKQSAESKDLMATTNESTSSVSNPFSAETTDTPTPDTSAKIPAKPESRADNSEHLSRSDPDVEESEEQLATKSAPKPDQILTPEIAVNGENGNLVWAPVDQERHLDEKNYRAFRLNISGPDGKVVEHSFGYGETPMLATSLNDGHYVWQSTIQPEIDPAIREQLMAVRESGNREAIKKKIEEFQQQGLFPSEDEIASNKQSGHFRVMDGQLVSANLEE